MYVCIYVCMYVCMCVCLYVCISSLILYQVCFFELCSDLFVLAHIHVYMHIHTHAYIHTCIHTYSLLTQKYIDIYMQTCVYIYTSTLTSLHKTTCFRIHSISWFTHTYTPLQASIDGALVWDHLCYNVSSSPTKKKSFSSDISFQQSQPGTWHTQIHTYMHRYIRYVHAYRHTSYILGGKQRFAYNIHTCEGTCVHMCMHACIEHIQTMHACTRLKCKKTRLVYVSISVESRSSVYIQICHIFHIHKPCRSELVRYLFTFIWPWHW
jgi:hypothetical protein